MPIPTDSERIGTTIDSKYRVESLLGKGGMGTVFRARHTWTGRAVALKVLQPQYAENDAVVLRFLREARAAASFRHPNVVEVLDMGSLPEGGAYMALAFLEGESLGAVLDRRVRLTVEETFAALVPVMRALELAHAKGIIHRDIKPDNIYLARNDEGTIVPTLLDFGIAKVTEDPGKVTTTGVIFGTPQYMSPEQARGVSDIDGRADLWSVAAVWFECLTGRPPFDGPVPTAVIGRILSERAPLLTSVLPGVPASIAACIDRCLEPDRAARYPNMDAFADALIDAAKAEKIELSPKVLSARRADASERTDAHRSIEAAKTLAASEVSTLAGTAERRNGVHRWSLVLGVVAFAAVVAASLVARTRASQATAQTPALVLDAGASTLDTNATDASHTVDPVADASVVAASSADDASTTVALSSRHAGRAGRDASAHAPRAATNDAAAQRHTTTQAPAQTQSATASGAHQTMGVSATW